MCALHCPRFQRIGRRAHGESEATIGADGLECSKECSKRGNLLSSGVEK